MLLNGDAGAINDKQKEYLNEVYYGNQRMIDLVNALLNVSRIEMGSFVIEPEMTDIVPIFRSVMDESKPKIDEKRLILHTDFQKDLPQVFLDKKLIRIVLQNLLTNAIKYTPESGNIFLMIFVKDEKLVISIRDEGFGIPLNEQDKIFNKLFRATNVKEKETDGTGLGLYIVKSILDNSGGSISFDSKEDRGSTFTVSIPISGMHKKDGERQLG
jgi:signal transduction histidine kinase